MYWSSATWSFFSPSGVLRVTVNLAMQTVLAPLRAPKMVDARLLEESTTRGRATTEEEATDIIVIAEGGRDAGCGGLEAHICLRGATFSRTPCADTGRTLSLEGFSES